MAEERVVLTAELRDQMSAPLQNAQRRVDGFTNAVETGARRQSAAVSRSTAQIDGSLTRQNRLFSGMSGAVGRATSGAARMFSGMRGSISRALDGLPEYTRQQGERAGQGFANGLKTAAGLVATYFGAQMVGGFIAEAARASDATDKFVSTMSFAGLDTSAITKARDEAKAYADQTVFDLPTIQKTMATLAANGVKDYTDITKAAGNLNAVAGGNAETFKSVSLALGQSAGAGKLMAEDWNMLADAIPGASGQLQNAMREAGAFEGNFKKAMENGEITAEEFQSAIMKLGNQPIAAEAAKSTKTFEGALGNLQATINSGLMKALDKIKPAATIAISALSDGLGRAMEWTGKAASGLYDLFVKGDFTGAFREAFNVEEDSPLVDLLFDIREGAIGLYDLLIKGDYQGMLRSAFGWEEDSAAVDMLLKLRDAAIELPGKIGDVVTKLWELRTPIAVVGGLILTFLIPGLVRAGWEALKSATMQKIAWAMTQTASTRAIIANSAAAWTVVGSWVLMGAQAMINAVRIAAAWLIAMGPVGWIIGLIALVVGALVWFFTQTELGQQIVQNVWAAIQVAIAAVVDWWNSTLIPAIQAIGKWFTDVFTAVVDWWNNTLMPAISAVGQWFVDMFTQVGNFGRDFVGMLVDGWGHLVNFWNSTIVPWLQALAAPFVAAYGWIERLAWNAMTIIVALWLKLVDLWNGVLLPAIQAVGQWFSDVFTGLWNNVLKPVVDSIVLGFQRIVDFFGTVFAWVYDNIIKPYIDLWVFAFNSVVEWWNMTFIPAMQAFGNWIGSIMTWIYETLIRPVIDFIVNGFGMLVDFWNLHLIPALQAVGDFFGTILNWIYETLVKPVIDNVVAAFTVLTDWWNNTLMPAAQAVGDWFTVTIGGAINGVKSFIDDIVKNFQTFITFVGDKLQPVIDGIKGAFDAVADAIGRVLGKIGEFAANPLGGIQDLLGIAKDEHGQGIMPSNSGGGVYPGGGVRFAGGGVLGGYAPGHDSILARLSPGESVLVPELTRAIGPQNIMAANAEASGGRPAGSGPTLTSGYSAGSSRGGATMTINAPISIQVAANGDGSVDTDALRAAVEEALEAIIAEHNRRGY